MSAPEPRSILLIRPSALGDVCRTVPVAVSLRRAFPHARLDWLVQDTFVDVVRHHPAVSRVVEFPRERLAEALRRGRVGWVVRWMNETLRQPRYDLVLDCQGLGRSGLFAWWTRAPVRVGFAPPEGRELAWLGVNHRVRVSSADGCPHRRHAVGRMLALVEALGVTPVLDMRLYAASDDLHWARQRAGLGRYVLVAPTSRWEAKRWPAERVAAAIERLLACGVPRIVVVGGAGERRQCTPLLELARRDPRVLDLVGATTVGQLMALVAGAAVVVANDSAAVHLAVGFDRPLVALYGPTRVDLVGPWGRTSDVIQHLRPGDRLDHKSSRAGGAIMARIGVEEVVEAVLTRWHRVGATAQAVGR